MGRSAGGFLKEAPNPPRTFLEFVFDRTNALRQSHAESLFKSQFNAARVQPPDTCMTGAIGNTGDKPPPGACFSGSACAASGLMPGVPGAVAPGKIILESPPSPPGKGVGGIGGKKANQRQGRQATKKASHPCEHHSGRGNRQLRGQAPAGCLLLRFSLCRKRFSAGVPAWQSL